MRVLVRFDFGGKVGLGHFSRCKAIAEALVDRGNEVFACGHHRASPQKYQEPPNFISDQIPFIPLRGRPNRRLRPSELILLEREDAEETVRLALRLKVELVFVDNYGIGKHWLELLQANFPVVAISDGTQYPGVKKIIDYGFSASRSNYAESGASGAGLILGSLFAPVSQDYSSFSLKPNLRSPGDYKCLVSLGGSSSSREVSKVQRLIRRQLPKVQFLEAVQYLQEGSARDLRPHSRKNLSPVSLADRLHRADFAVVSAGVTMYEMLASGTPGLALVTAENQRPAFDAARKADYIKEFTAVAPAANLTQLTRDLASPDSPIHAWLAGRSIVDDLGARRIAAEVLPTANPGFNLRPYASHDSPILLRLRNQNSSIKGFFSGRRVTTSEHLIWFDKHMSSEDQGFIFEMDGLPVGQCRLTNSNQGCNLSYSILDEYQGRGLSVAMLATLFSKIRVPTPVWAHVRSNNSASVAALKRCSFESFTSNSEKVVMVRWKI